MRCSRDCHGRLVGTTLAQDMFNILLTIPVFVIAAISLLFFPPAKRVGSATSWA